MPKFLFEAQYSPDGLSGLAADGAAKRQSDVKAAFKSLGGKVEAFYFSFGDNDAIVVVDLPDNAAAAAGSIMAALTGTATVRTIPLLTVAEADEAIKKAQGARYRPPGGQA